MPNQAEKKSLTKEKPVKAPSHDSYGREVSAVAPPFSQDIVKVGGDSGTKETTSSPPTKDGKISSRPVMIAAREPVVSGMYYAEDSHKYEAPGNEEKLKRITQQPQQMKIPAKEPPGTERVHGAVELNEDDGRKTAKQSEGEVDGEVLNRSLAPMVHAARHVVPGAVPVPGVRGGNPSVSSFRFQPANGTAEGDSRNHDATTQNMPTVTATAVDDLVVHATPVEEIKQREMAEALEMKKAKRRRYLGLTCCFVLFAVVLGVSISVPLSLRPPPLPRDLSCVPPEGKCVNTYEELDGALQSPDREGTGGIVVICAGSSITLEKELIVKEDDLKLCCEGNNNDCSLEAAEKSQVLQVSGNSIYLIGIAFRVLGVDPGFVGDGGARGNVNIAGGGHHKIDTCVFSGGVAKEFAGTGGNLNVDGLGFANITVRSTVFENGFADDGGGGAFLTGVTNVDIRNCTFTNNRAGYGGGFVVTEGHTLLVEHSIFVLNSVLRAGGAGWMRTSNAYFIVNNAGSENNATKCDELMDNFVGQCIDFDGSVVDDFST